MPDYRVQGGRDLRRTLRQAGYNMRQLGQANRRVGEVIRPVASAKAPKVTGALARSIKPMAQQSRVRLQSRKPYAGPIHWGWKARNIEPHEFLSDAATSTEPTWFKVYEREMLDALSQIRGIK